MPQPKPKPKAPVRTAASEAMKSLKSPNPKIGFKKEVTSINTKGNVTTTKYPKRENPVTLDNGKKAVTSSQLTKVTTRVPVKKKK
jgi:hypothetical protein